MILRAVRALCILAAVCAALTACSPGKRPSGHVSLRISADPTTLDPALIVDVTGGLIAAKLFNGLVRLGDDLGIVPDIAERWEVRDNGLSYIFHLRKGVTFSNGREVTAHDFLYSFRRVLDPATGSPNTWVFEKIAGAKDYAGGRRPDVPGLQVLDDATLRITLSRPFAPFLQLLSMTAAYVIPREEVSSRGSGFQRHPVGTGPFVLSNWSHHQELVLERNDAYFQPRARVRGITFRIIPEDLTAVTEFEVGNLDVITLPAPEYRRYADSSMWAGLISGQEGLNTYYLGFNCARQPFASARLRRAVSHAIDREKILRTYYEGRGRLASGPVPDSIRKWRPAPEAGYDPGKARELITREGMLGRTVNFYITSDQEVRDIAEIIQAFLAKAGLPVKITQLEWSAYKAALNHGEADLFWISWWADYPDPENFFFPLFHSSNHGAGGNRTRYANKDVDRYIELAQAESVPEKRYSAYSAAEAVIMGELPLVPFWHRKEITLRQPYLKNYRIYPIYSMDKGTEISL